MSGKLIINIIVAFILSGIGYSCKSTNNVSSEKLLQKRKYRSGFYVNLPRRSHSSIDEYSHSRMDLASSESKSIDVKNLQQLDLSSIINKEAQKKEKSNMESCARIINKDQNIENYNDKKSVKVPAIKESVYIDDPPKQKLELLGFISFFIMILGILLFILGGSTFVGILLLIAILFSIISLVIISKSKGALTGKGWAIATLVLSGIFLIGLYIWALAWAGAF